LTRGGRPVPESHEPLVMSFDDAADNALKGDLSEADKDAIRQTRQRLKEAGYHLDLSERGYGKVPARPHTKRLRKVRMKVKRLLSRTTDK